LGEASCRGHQCRERRNSHQSLHAVLLTPAPITPGFSTPRPAIVFLEIYPGGEPVRTAASPAFLPRRRGPVVTMGMHVFAMPAREVLGRRSRAVNALF
jgi:hypothetical protein